MFNFFKRLFLPSQPTGERITFKIQGMHCTSCALNIDGELEELAGVHSAATSYAKAETEVVYDPAMVTVKKIQEVIRKLGYLVEK